VGKGKLRKWAEIKYFQNVIEHEAKEIFGKDFHLKGNWAESFFKNSNPVSLELGCGKGEYTLGLAKAFPERNFLGIDIKGSRIWRGAKTAIDLGLKNAGFLRTRIELIHSFFGTGEIEEIWITFPDPQLKKRRWGKRLTSASFLNSYKSFLKPEGIIHLKTDSKELFDYTKALLVKNEMEILQAIDDLYHDKPQYDLLALKTYYEQKFLEEGKKITYICFKLPQNRDITEPDLYEKE
jgi:tRNA (guanine-N7-)-methyltransferase